ncbi:MAG: Na+/H+ antiporter subunit E [Anaerovoracaceae bacterium]
MQRRQQQILSQFLGLALGLFAIWIMLSGQFETKFLLIGFFSSLAISYVCFPLLLIKGADGKKDFFVFGVNYLKLLLYFLWLIGEILKASLDVAKEIMKPHMNYEPRVVHFSMPYENPMANVVLANSIILTPGTITLDVTESGIFEVHALTKGAAEDLLSGVMAEKVAKLYGETCSFTPMPEAEITDIPKEAY